MVGTEVLLAPEPTATAHVLFSLSCGLMGGLHVRLVRKENGHWDYEGGEQMKTDGEALGADLPVWRCTQNLQPKAKFTYRYVVSNGAAFIHLSSILTFTPPPSPSPSSSSSLARDDGNFGALFGLSFPTSEQSLWLHSHTQLSLTVGYPEFYHYSPSHPRVGLVLDGDVQTYSVTSSVWSGRAKLHETSHDLHTTASFQLPNFSAATSVTLDVQLSNVSKGKVSVLTSQFVLGHGVITAPLMDASFFVIGSLTFHYSIITPFTHSSLQACNRQAFPSRPTLVGHRGSGAEGSRTQIAGSPRSHIKENTLLSFEKAGTSGAHFVEFDAHLTSDMVPVIYHDFSVAHSGISTPIHAMTLAEFKKIGSKAIKKTTSLSNFQSYLPGSVPASSSATPSLPTPIFDSFPTLKETLQQVPANIGFNIEIKYPMKDELDHHNLRPVDRNTYVDCILWAVFEYAKNRDIVFSSFDPDICVLLSRKQPKYPVLFLTEMGTLIRSDPRSNSPEASIHFVKTHSLQGLVCPASFLLRNPNVVDKIKKAELVVATWGRDNNNPSNVDTQLALGVNGIIVDHVAHIAKHWNKAVVG